MNIPYTRKSGIVIDKAHPYVSTGNRATRRKKEPPFKGNVGHISLTVTGKSKYYRETQIVNGRIIQHYRPAVY